MWLVYLVFFLALVSNCLVGYYISARRGENDTGKVRDVGFEMLPRPEPLRSTSTT
jgi:hypothetical protein